MLPLHRKITAVVAACFMYLTAAPASFALTASSNPALTGDITATVTAHKGTVFKRDFIDWNREVWGEPSQVGDNDKLREGMQVGTGNDSWAEVSWPSVKTRAWANTVFAVAPNKRLVYLTGGEMLFRLDKHRKDKDPYYIWTKVLQARIRGTTVLVQAKGPMTRFTVMEGVVDIFNRLDHSRVTLHPGVVYEIKGYNMSKAGAMPSINGAPPAAPTTSGPSATPKPFDSSIKEITYDPKNYQPIFQDSYASSNAYAANREALMHHPLVTAGGEIDSMQLIDQAQQHVPGYNSLVPIKLAGDAVLDKVVARGLDIDAVPSRVNYFIGQEVGKDIKLPATAYSVDLSPTGTIVSPARHNLLQAQAALPHPAPAVGMPVFLGAPVESSPAETADPNSDAKRAQQEIQQVFNPAAEVADYRSAQDKAAQVFQEDPIPLPVKSYAAASAAVSRADVPKFNTAGLAPANLPAFSPGSNTAVGAAGAFQTASGVSSMAGPAATGAINAASGAMGAGIGVMGNTVSGVGGLTSTIVPTVNGAASPVTGLMTGSMHSVQTLIPPVGGGIGQALNNTTNAINGLLR